MALLLVCDVRICLCEPSAAHNNHLAAVNRPYLLVVKCPELELDVESIQPRSFSRNLYGGLLPVLHGVQPKDGPAGRRDHFPTIHVLGHNKFLHNVRDNLCNCKLLLHRDYLLRN